jgi:hypothetical protein
MVEPFNHLICHSLIQSIEVHSSSGRSRNRAPHRHQHNIIVAMPIGIITFPKYRSVVLG